METETQRLELLFGKENVQKLRQATVFVAGVGGVGSYAAEALARSAIGHLILMDADVVALSNCNRQIMATRNTVGQSKTQVMKERIQSYSDCAVTCIDAFLNPETLPDLSNVDYAIDAIDTVSSKCDFIEACHTAKIPFLCSLGMGNRLDPSQVTYTTLDKTQGDPLARVMRSAVKKRGISYEVPVLYSPEVPRKQTQVVDPDGTTRKQQIPPASCIFVPAEAGLLAASVVVRTLIGDLHVR